MILVKRSGGYAFIQFKTEEAAKRAIQDTHTICNKKIIVDIAVKKGKTRTETKPNDIDSSFTDPEKHVYPPVEIYENTLYSNQIEIISMARYLTPCAEEIKTILKSLGLAVNVGYQKKGFTIPNILKYIKSLKTPFVLVLRPESIRQQPVTVTLYRMKRNNDNWQKKEVPLDAAIERIKQDFKDYIDATNKRATTSAATNSVPVSPPPVYEPYFVPEGYSEIDDLLDNMLRSLQTVINYGVITTAQMDEFITSCEELRNDLADSEG